MKLKAILCILLIASLTLALAACGSGSKSLDPAPATSGTESAGRDTTAAPTETASTTESTTEEAEEPSSEEAEDTTETPETEGSTEDVTEEAQTEEPQGGSATGEAIAATAEGLIGAAFKYGADGPDTFDNSGFVYYCYKQNGVKIPRRTSQMSSAGTAVTREELKRGDVVLFSNEIGGNTDFAGIYIGGGQFISCNTETSPVGIRSLSSGYWADRFVEGRRVAG